MSRIKLANLLFVAVLLGLWTLGAAWELDWSDGGALGAAFTQITGLLSIGLMAFANVLAIRPRWLEPALDGMDKMYRLHKWLALQGLALGVLHWVTHGLGTRLASLQAFFAGTPDPLDWRSGALGPAFGMAQSIMAIMLVMAVVALSKRVRYTTFARSHVLMVPLFLALAFHSVLLMEPAYWTTVIGWVTLGLIGLGSVAALIGLGHHFGFGRRAKAKVIAATHHPELRVVEAELLVNAAWPGHQAGQFAFVTTDWKEGAHPFTIATRWNPKDRRIGFITKDLGDYSSRMQEHFAKGHRVVLEGPYGTFTFTDTKPRQIWIAGGVGIVPFVARMRHLAQEPDGKVIDLFHSSSEMSQPVWDKMRRDAERAGVRLHLVHSPEAGRLDAAKIIQAVPDWPEASLWFCGPSAFGAALQADFTARGLAAADWHEELFEMR